MLVGIGIDSGGSHTTVAIARDELSQPEVVDESSNSISDARGRRAIRSAAEWMVGRVLARTEERDEICVWIGAAAGFPGKSTSDVVEEFNACVPRLRELRPDCEIYIANDAVSILKAPPILGQGIVAIVGTGSIALGTHPSAPDVVRRGGYEWPVGDQGAGIWMTIEAIRLVIDDIQDHGSLHYQSPLLDRLCDYFGVSAAELAEVPDSHSALARVEALAALVANARDDNKRFVAGFVHPHLIGLARVGGGSAHDPIAARVVSSSVNLVSEDIAAISEILAAYTADNPNDRAKLQLVVGGSIAANEFYRDQLAARVSQFKYIQPIDIIGDAAVRYSQLAMHYLRSPSRERRVLTRSLDPTHQVLKLL